MLEQPSLLFTGVLGVAGLLIRGVVAQRDNHADELDSAIKSLEDVARNDMLVPLAELLVDVEEHEFEASDGNDEDVDPDIPEVLPGMWTGNRTIEDEKKFAMGKIIRVIEEDRADPGRPEEKKLEELQGIRRDMHAGADLESARWYHDRVGKCEWGLKRSLELVVALAVIGLVPQLAIWEQFVSFAPSQAISAVNTVLVVILVLAVGLSITSAVLHWRSKPLFERNDIDP